MDPFSHGRLARARSIRINHHLLNQTIHHFHMLVIMHPTYTWKRSYYSCMQGTETERVRERPENIARRNAQRESLLADWQPLKVWYHIHLSRAWGQSRQTCSRSEQTCLQHHQSLAPQQADRQRQPWEERKKRKNKIRLVLAWRLKVRHECIYIVKR